LFGAMEIKNKEKFKLILREEIMQYIKQFPVYFWMNILINLIIIAVFILTAVAIFFSISVYQSGFVYYGLIFMAVLLKMLHTTFRNFLKNLHILGELKEKQYGNEIEEYELDNIVEFVEQLPMKKEEVEKMKIELSYGKLINILDLIGIITYENDMCYLDVRLQEKVELDDF
jgi:hypothetical protein